MKALSILFGIFLVRFLFHGEYLAVDSAVVIGLILLQPYQRGEWALLPIIYIAILVSDYSLISQGYYHYSDSSVHFWALEPIFWYFYGMAAKRFFAEEQYPSIDKSTLLYLFLPFILVSGLSIIDARLFLGSFLLFLLVISIFYLDRKDIQYGIFLVLLGVAIEFFGVSYLQSWEWHKLLVFGPISALLFPLWYFFGVALRRIMIPLSLGAFSRRNIVGH